jgi:hypothetical protein
MDAHRPKYSVGLFAGKETAVAGMKAASLSDRDLRGLMLALKRMDKGASDALRRDVAAISQWSGQQIKQAAPQSPMPAQSAVIARSITSRRDRIPNIQAGGRRAYTTGQRGSRVAAGVLWAGNEFGAKTFFPNGGRRFPFRSPQNGRGSLGYVIFPTLRRIQPELTRRWKSAVQARVFGEWSRG